MRITSTTGQQPDRPPTPAPVTVTNVTTTYGGMTLAELATFVQDCYRRDLDPQRSVVKVRSTLGGKVLQVSATGPTA